MHFHHIAISVKDSEKSVEFYKKNFGFKEVRRFTKPDWDGGAIVLSLDNIELEIFQFNDSTDKKDNLSDLKVIGLKHIGIEVEDVDQKHRELKTQDVDIDDPKQGTTCAKFCFLRDPDGIPIELYQRE